MKAFGCPDDAALAGNADEAAQVFEVQHGTALLIEKLEHIAYYYLFVSNTSDAHNPANALLPMGKPDAAPDPRRRLALTEGLRGRIVRRLECCLSHRWNMVSRVVVRLSDVNGPGSGAHKRCSIEVRLKGPSTIAVDDIHTDFCVTIDRAAERAEHTLDRRIARRLRPARVGSGSQPALQHEPNICS